MCKDRFDELFEKHEDKHGLNTLYDDIFKETRPTKETTRELLGLPPLGSNNDFKHTVQEFIDSVEEEERRKDDQEVKRVLGMQGTLVVNLFAGPGTGKSTMAAGIFHDLKSMDVNCELAAEFAKDLVWEQRHKTFEDQIYLFAKQYHRIFRLLGQVDVVITDCPILLSPVYDVERRLTFQRLVVEEHRKMWTYNVFLKRKKMFNPKGRNHNLEQAVQLDKDILNQLDDLGESYETVDGTTEGKNKIVNQIISLLQFNNLFVKK